MAGQELVANLLTCIQEEKQAQLTVKLYEDMEYETSVQSEETHRLKRSLAYYKRKMRALPKAKSIANKPAALQITQPRPEPAGSSRRATSTKKK